MTCFYKAFHLDLAVFQFEHSQMVCSRGSLVAEFLVYVGKIEYGHTHPALFVTSCAKLPQL